MNEELKPMLSSKNLIEHMKNKGIKFNIMSEEDAQHYLEENVNFYKLYAYRKNFPKHPDGQSIGKYINLDFAMLKDLSIIDMRLRYLFIQMTLDVEHFAKIKLLKALESSNDNGYDTLNEYFEHLKSSGEANSEKNSRYNKLRSEIENKKNNPYCGEMINKYIDNFPVWVFVEIITLGTFCDFLKFCSTKYNDKQLKNIYYLLLTIKDLRNASAHSNCIINSLGKNDKLYNPDYNMCRILSEYKAQARNQLSNEHMRQIITLLYTHSIIVTSKGVKEHTKNMISDVIERMYLNESYYKDASNITTAFDFFRKAFDKFYN